YDFVLWLLGVVFSCFFREIRPRGAFRLPRNPKQPIIFVGAPHANQFVDPIVLMGQVQNELHRRVSFLIALKSFKRKWIGRIAKCAMAIPVSRAQDNLTTASGKIFIDLDEFQEGNYRIFGKNTVFSKECVLKGLISLPNSLGSAEIEKIISDTELILRKDFKYANSKNAETAKEILVNGTTFKTAAKIDQSQVYAKVFQHLSKGNCLGIFPEGGSHDRPDLLPLKAGVAIMALGAMANDSNCKVKIVPCGMNYFHPNKFRSRAIVEFGSPIDIPEELVEMYRNPTTSKEAVKELLEIVKNGLKSVTVTCPDFETLVCVQAARRLYANNFSSRLSLELIIEMNRRLVKGYTHFISKDPRLNVLKNKILKYNDLLKIYNIPDHEVENCKPRLKIFTFLLLILNFTRVLILLLFCIPGFLLFSPVFIATKRISNKKSKEALAASTVKIKAIDVVATWKILVSMGFAPLLYFFYSIVGTSLLFYHNIINRSLLEVSIVFWSIFIFNVVITYSALIIGDRGMDYFKSLRPLWLILLNESKILELKQMRKELSLEITEIVNDLGPQLYPDFNLLEYQRKINDKKKRKKRQIDEQEEEEAKTQKAKLRRQARKSK
ncbi:hypothetical protein PACTADRAFT_27232, partial [Pachysolen tannophilus NRRL Y-2460]